MIICFVFSSLLVASPKRKCGQVLASMERHRSRFFSGLLVAPPKRKCGQMERHMSWFFSGLPMLCQRQCIQTWSARSARPPHWLFLMSRRWYGTCLFRQWSGWKCFWDAPWVGAANSTVGTIRHTANLHRTKAPKSRADPRSCGSAANYAAVFSSRTEELHWNCSILLQNAQKGQDPRLRLHSAAQAQQPCHEASP